MPERQYLDTKPTYFDMIFKVCPPLDFVGYGVPVPYTGGTRMYRDNEMVSYIAGTAERQRQSGSGLGSIEAIFEDRLGLIRSKVELILMQLAERKRIRQEVLDQIDQDKIYAQDLIRAMGPKKYLWDRDRLALERQKFDLEKQRRMEQVSYFRDTGLLNKDLKDTLIEYLGEVQKSALLNGAEEKP
jgi:hypothetical protein